MCVCLFCRQLMDIFVGLCLVERRFLLFRGIKSLHWIAFVRGLWLCRKLFHFCLWSGLYRYIYSWSSSCSMINDCCSCSSLKLLGFQLPPLPLGYGVQWLSSLSVLSKMRRTCRPRRGVAMISQCCSSNLLANFLYAIHLCALFLQLPAIDSTALFISSALPSSFLGVPRKSH